MKEQLQQEFDQFLNILESNGYKIHYNIQRYPFFKFCKTKLMRGGIGLKYLKSIS